MKRHTTLLIALVLLSLLVCGVASAQKIAFKDAEIWTATGERIKQGVLLVDAEGKIQAVGEGVAIPAGYTVVEARGKILTPGFIDANTSLGAIEIGAVKGSVDHNAGGKDPVRAAFRIADGLNPYSAIIPVQRSGGITSVVTRPHGGLVSGLGAWMDLGSEDVQRHANVRQEQVALYVSLGQEGAAQVGGSRAAAILRLRELFDDAQFYKAQRKKFDENRSRTLTGSRLDLESVLLAMEGKIPVVFKAHSAADILAVLSLAKQWKLRPIIQGGGEAWRVREALAEARVPVILHALSNLPNSFEMLGNREDNAALLEKAGVPVILSVFDTHNARNVRQMAGNAVRAGLSPEAALRAITIEPAKAFGLGDKLGSLEVGHVANLTLWSGDPLEISSGVEGLYVEGRAVSLDHRQRGLFEKYKVLPRRDPPAMSEDKAVGRK